MNRITLILLLLIFTFHSNKMEGSNNSDQALMQKYYERGEYDSAILIFNNSRVNDFQALPQLYNIVGKCYLGNKRFEKAKSYFELALDVNAGVQYSPEEKILSYLELVTIAKNNAQVSVLKRELDCALRLYNEFGIKQLEPYVLLGRANYYEFIDQMKSYDLYMESIDSFQENNPDILDAYDKLLDFLLSNQEFDKANKLFEKVMFLGNKKFKYHKPKYANLLLMKGFYWYKLGRYQKSFNVLNEEYLPFIEEERSDWAKYMKGEYYRVKGWIYNAMGNYEKSIEWSEKYLKVTENFYEPKNRMFYQVFMLLFSANKSIGNYELANKYLEKGFNIGKESEDIEMLFFSKFQKGINSQHFGDYYNAQLEFQSVLNYDVKRKAHDKYKIQSIENLAKIYFQEEDLESSKEYVLKGMSFINLKFGENSELLLKFLTQYLSILIREENHIGIDSLITNVFKRYDFDNLEKDDSKISFINVFSEYLIKADLLDSVEIYLNKAFGSSFENIELAKEKGNYSFSKLMISSLMNMGEYYKKKFIVNGDIETLENSMEQFKIIVELIDTHSKDYRSREDRINVGVRNNEILSKAILVASQLYTLTKHKEHYEFALSVSEYLKSKQLLEEINRTSATNNSGIPDSLLWKINSSKQQESFLLTQIKKLEKFSELGVSDSTKLEDFKMELISNNSSFLRLMKFLESNYWNYFDYNYNTIIPSFVDIQQRLNSCEAVFEYFLSSESQFVFSITKDSINLISLELIDSGVIKSFQRSIHSKKFIQNPQQSYEKYVEQSYELYQSLLEKPLKSLAGQGISKLYIIADKELNYLSFELLIQSKPTSPRANFQKLDYLINDYSISYGYSSSILFRNSPKRTQRARNTNVLAIAPSYNNLLNDDIKLAQLGKFRDGFTELKYNREEVDRIKKYFRGDLLKDEEATEQTFLEKFKDYDILHFAMHALVDNEDSDNSKLIFTSRDDSTYDSYLHSFELYNMNMNPRLAVLSACDTGNSKVVKE